MNAEIAAGLTKPAPGMRVREFQATAKPKDEMTVKERLEWAKSPGEGDTLLLLYCLGSVNRSNKNKVISVAARWVNGIDSPEPILADMGLKLVAGTAMAYPELNWLPVGGVDGAKQYFHNVHNEHVKQQREKERLERKAIDGPQRNSYFRRKIGKLKKALSNRA